MDDQERLLREAEAIFRGAANDVEAEAVRDNEILGVIAVVIELRRTSQSARIVIMRPDGTPV